MILSQRSREQEKRAGEKKKRWYAGGRWGRRSYFLFDIRRPKNSELGTACGLFSITGDDVRRAQGHSAWQLIIMRSQ